MIVTYLLIFHLVVCEERMAVSVFLKPGFEILILKRQRRTLCGKYGLGPIMLCLVVPNNMVVEKPENVFKVMSFKRKANLEVGWL